MFENHTRFQQKYSILSKNSLYFNLTYILWAFIYVTCLCQILLDKFSFAAIKTNTRLFHECFYFEPQFGKNVYILQLQIGPLATTDWNNFCYVDIILLEMVEHTNDQIYQDFKIAIKPKQYVLMGLFA